MFHAHLASKLFAINASKEKSRLEGTSKQWCWVARKSVDVSNNHGSATVANAARSCNSSTYAEDMYKLWLKDKNSVHSSWDKYFSDAIAANTENISSTFSSVTNSIDKEQLVQYVKPKDSTIHEVQMREEDGPIVIKIDITNAGVREPNVGSDELSVTTVDSKKTLTSANSSNKSYSIQSEQSLRSQIEPAQKTEMFPLKTIAGMPTPTTGAREKEEDSVTRLQFGTMGTDSSKVVPSQIESKQISEVPVPKKAPIVPAIPPVPEFKTWQQHVLDYQATYHSVTRDEAIKLPDIQKKINIPTVPTTSNRRTVVTHFEPHESGVVASPVKYNNLSSQSSKITAPRSPQSVVTKTAISNSNQNIWVPVAQQHPVTKPESSSKDSKRSITSSSTINLSLANRSRRAASGAILSAKPALRSRTQVLSPSSQFNKPSWEKQAKNQKHPPSSQYAIKVAPTPQTSAKASTSPGSKGSATGGIGGENAATIQQHLAVMGVIRSYQNRGHLEARTDPLGILDKNKKSLEDRKGRPSNKITRQHKALEAIDLNTPYQLPMTTFIGQGAKSLPLGEIIKRLEAAYTAHIGVEFMYIQNMEKTLWIREKLESPNHQVIDKDVRIRTLKRLIRATLFEAFLAKKYSAEKRFGLEGCEVLIPCIKQIIDTVSDQGCDGINIAMPHRGRLNVLANVCRKSLKNIFTTFVGLPSADEGSGDVKYHLGTVITRENSVNKKKVRISVVANPSHLEACGPTCLGKTKCEQFLKGDKDGSSILGIYMHGDASFSGQGVCFESIHLGNLPCYTTRGSIHIVVNNQVGFTTDPRFSRSSPYCTDVGRVILAPIFHVNADDPDAVIKVSKIAAEWRQKFHDDVVIDLVSYRRNGHNEQDEPMFTQPLMYQLIKKHPNVAKIYGDLLIKEGILQQVEIDSYTKEYDAIMESDFSKAKDEKQMAYRDWLDSPWKGFFKKYKFEAFPNTGVQEEVIQQIGKHFSTAPPNFAIHRGIERILKGRAKMVTERQADWSLGEAFAYASLMKDGYHVRLSGQDVERGTFSHRHHVLHHQTKDMETFNILENIFPNQAPYTVCNSSLSEYAVLGFDMGYSLVSPYQLVMWEGQFGDFANNGQVVIDQYLACGQSKWFRQCGLVVQLPHSMEGAGPEHSSGRLERFLQMCDDDVDTNGPYDEKYVLYQHEHCNWFVCNCTTPATLFHLLRRQMLLPFRKPLILFTPKSVLRHPRAKSSFDEFLEGKTFQRVLPDVGPASKNPELVKKLIFCAGKTYYDIIGWIEEAKLEGQIAVTRTEQFSPFPYDLIAGEIKKYKNAKIYWAQEEHKNQGGWTYMQPRIKAAGGNKADCEYNGRPVSSAPATGNKQTHLTEMKNYKEAILKIQ